MTSACPTPRAGSFMPDTQQPRYRFLQEPRQPSWYLTRPRPAPFPPLNKYAVPKDSEDAKRCWAMSLVTQKRLLVHGKARYRYPLSFRPPYHGRPNGRSNGRRRTQDDRHTQTRP